MASSFLGFSLRGGFLNERMPGPTSDFIFIYACIASGSNRQDVLVTRITHGVVYSIFLPGCTITPFVSLRLDHVKAVTPCYYDWSSVFSGSASCSSNDMGIDIMA